MINLENSTYNYNNYIITDNIVSLRAGGRANTSEIIELQDGSEWVVLTDRAKERFCGFLYLQNAIKSASLSGVLAAENKMMIDGDKIIYLSKYCGEKRPDTSQYIDKISQLASKIGFTDTAESTNLREIDKTIYVFDTEKSSFNQTAQQKIDSFIALHNAIKEQLVLKLV